MGKAAKFVNFEPEKALNRPPTKRKRPHPEMDRLVGRFSLQDNGSTETCGKFPRVSHMETSPFGASRSSYHPATPVEYNIRLPRRPATPSELADSADNLPPSPPQQELQLPEQLRPPAQPNPDAMPPQKRLPPLSDTPAQYNDQQDPFHPLNYSDKLDAMQVHKTLSQMKAYYDGQREDKGRVGLDYKLDRSYIDGVIKDTTTTEKTNDMSTTDESTDETTGLAIVTTDKVQLTETDEYPAHEGKLVVPHSLPKLRVHVGVDPVNPHGHGLGQNCGSAFPIFSFSRLDPQATSVVQQIAKTPNERKLLQNYLQFLSPYFDYLPQPQLTALIFDTFEPELTKKIVLTMSYLHLISASSQHTLVKKHVVYIKLCFFKLLHQEGFLTLASMSEDDAYKLRSGEVGSKLDFKNTSQSRKNIKAILILLISMVVIETINGGRSSAIRNHMYMYGKIVSQREIRDYLIQENSGKFLINSYVWFDLITSASSHDSRAPFISNPEMFDGPSIGLNYMVNCSIKTMQILYEVTVLRSEFKAFQEDLAQSTAYTPQKSNQLRALWERGQSLKRHLLVELHAECAAGFPEHSEEHTGCKCWILAVLVFLLRIFKSCKPEVWADIRALCIQFVDLNLRLNPANKVANMLVWPLFLVGCELKNKADFVVTTESGTKDYQALLRARISRLRHSLGVGNWRTLQTIVESCWKHEVDWEVHLGTGIWKQHDFMPI